jgi:hypothetical protein
MKACASDSQSVSEFRKETIMGYLTKKIDTAGKARLAQLDLRIDHHRPNSDEWTIDDATGDFLIWIYPDREPPHWTTYCFYWNDTPFGLKIAMSGDFTRHLVYSVMSVYKVGSGWDLTPSESVQFVTAMTAALHSYCSADAKDLVARKFKDLAFEPRITVSIDGLSASPSVVLNIDLPGVM